MRRGLGSGLRVAGWGAPFKGGGRGRPEEDAVGTLRGTRRKQERAGHGTQGRETKSDAVRVLIP